MLVPSRADFNNIWSCSNKISKAKLTQIGNRDWHLPENAYVVDSQVWFYQNLNLILQTQTVYLFLTDLNWHYVGRKQKSQASTPWFFKCLLLWGFSHSNRKEVEGIKAQKISHPVAKIIASHMIIGHQLTVVPVIQICVKPLWEPRFFLKRLYPLNSHLCARQHTVGKSKVVKSDCLGSNLGFSTQHANLNKFL